MFVVKMLDTLLARNAGNQYKFDLIVYEWKFNPPLGVDKQTAMLACLDYGLTKGFTIPNLD
jgi:hypothetical protein